MSCRCQRSEDNGQIGLFESDRMSTETTQITTRYNRGMQKTNIEADSSRRPHWMPLLTAKQKTKNNRLRLQFAQALNVSQFMLRHSDRVRDWHKAHEKKMDPSY